MVTLFNPSDGRVDSNWIYPFPIPKSPLSRGDEKMIDKAARRDRLLFLRLPAGEKTPALIYYEASCHRGQEEVQARHIKHQSDIANETFKWQVVLAGEGPAVIKPRPDVPPTSTPERQDGSTISVTRRRPPRRCADTSDSASVQVSER